ncbi:MAG: glutamate 5-kinase [Spirochaetaceae bacterium]|jgi:glutamate 5-kinase|nr:glutamate 5-kinase [Spirochaetaceae bacterium]
MISDLIASSRKIVLKFGSSTLTDERGRLNASFMEQTARDCAGFIKAGKQIALVSSGAQAAGLAAMERWERKRDVHYRQALCAVGQVELMGGWRNAFKAEGLNVAQILLTAGDFATPVSALNLRNTLFTLADEGVVPVINENDSVSVDEIKIGDNDNLAALTAVLWSADLLILLSDIDGLFKSNPKEDPNAEFIQTVNETAAIRGKITINGISALGSGGIATKIEAAEKALSDGIPTVITRGRADALSSLASGEQRGTEFLA